SQATAERETHEELALNLSQGAQVMGRMSDILATAGGRHLPLVVTPWVYRVEGDPELAPNAEVDEALWVRLSYFKEPKNREFFDYNIAGFRLRLPCYHYEGRTIWGLTLKMVDELLDIESRAQKAAQETYMQKLMRR